MSRATGTSPEIPADECYLRVQTEVAQAALSSLNPAVLVPRLLEVIGRAQDYRYGLFWRVLPRENAAVVEATFGEGAEAFLGFRECLDESSFFAGVAIRSGQPAVCNRRQQTAFRTHPIGDSLGAQALLALPIVQREGRVVGAFVFGDSTDPDRFSDRDVTQGTVLASQVAQAIENAALFTQVRALQHQYQLMTDSLDDAVFTVDAEGRFTFANRAAERLTGYGLAELRGHTFMEIVSPADLAVLVDRLRRAMAGEAVPSRIEVTVIRKDGQPVVLELAVTNLVVDGRPTGRVGVARDITERKRWDAAQAERARLLSLIADIGVAVAEGRTIPGLLQECADTLVWRFGAALVRIWRLDQRAPGLRLGASAGTAAGPPPAVGQAEAEAIARERRPHFTNVAADDPFIADREWTRQAGVVAYAGVPLVVADRLMGVMAMFACHPFTEADLEAMQSAAIAVAQGIDRLIAEEALRESEERFRSAFEDTAIGMALQTLDGRYVRVNRAFSDMVGYGEAELLAMSYEAITHPDDRALDRESDQEMLAGRRQSYQVEKRYVHKAGHVVCALTSVAVVHGPDGCPAHLIVQAYDITERKHAEAARASLEEQLRQAQKMEAVGRLAGGIAHDFNNLLTVIMGRSERLLGPLEPDHPLHRHAALIQKTADRAAGLTRQLLAFSRKQVVQPRVVQLGGIVQGLHRMLRSLIGEHITLETEILPQGGWIRVDPGQLEQVLLNLVLNARDAMPDGGRLRIETSEVLLEEAAVRDRAGVVPGAYVVLNVRDTGRGMTVETKAHLFEPFFTTKGPGEGTGLGLAIVYGVVTQAGGFIDVDSRLGRGTSFRVHLPRVEPDVTAREEPSVVPARRGSETILVVEDETDVRDLAREILEGYGYAVLEARNAREALRVSARYPAGIDLLLTDVVMPRGNGCALAARLVAERPGLKVLFMSGYTDDALVPQGLRDWARLLNKPFRPDALQHAVSEALDAPAPGPPAWAADLAPPTLRRRRLPVERTLARLARRRGLTTRTS